MFKYIFIYVFIYLYIQPIWGVNTIISNNNLTIQVLKYLKCQVHGKIISV